MGAPSSLVARLKSFGQDHLLRFWDRLSDQEREQLTGQIESIDFGILQSLRTSQDKESSAADLAVEALAPPAVRLGQVSEELDASAKELGEGALRAGKVGVILVAGGQGTRLGFDAPKGTFEIGPLSHRTLFEMHVDRLMAVMKRYSIAIPFYVMTSPATDAATRAFFAEHHRFGLPEELLHIFCQGTMPAVEEQTGRVLMSGQAEIALSPDGHGGMLQALDRKGCLEHARRSGIEYFFYAQVDNPLVPLCDPTLMGHHIRVGSQMTTQVVRKRFAKEKVGNVVQVRGRVAIIEYSDLPDSVAEKTNADGSLLLWAGNIAVHVMDRSFLEQALREAKLPFHRARKSVPFVNAEGEVVKPSQPNAIKYEKFIFDLLPLANNALVVEADAREVFAPVKNAAGSPTDAPEHAQKAIIDLHSRWLQHAGVAIADGVLVEINPRWALDGAEVAAKIQSPAEDPIRIEADTYFSVS